MVALPTKISWRHASIGIIAENIDWRGTLRAIFNRLGAVDIVDGSDGAVFLAAADNFGRGFDLLMVDDVMAPLDGFMLLRHLRGAVDHPSRRAVAILMASETESASLAKALQAGFHAVLPKPFSAQAVADRAERLLAMPLMWQDTGGLLLPLLPKQG